ncbi:HD-GYP domain-containing protein [Leptospira ryugenii]|uniref:HD-GYP domain-containing protein n=1 Tax=Leptospira ryugenii TaxID=1917863 RepID=A0A2P2E1K8_9LEPT|nr:c-di-GMP phosphodiesterase [Leptospira ryugenii]GBF50762.1 HD-GYP domain-containing protein [Leptospira ryugenii]
MSANDRVSSDQLAKFDLSEESLNAFRMNQNIPFDLYNKDGQVVMPKTKNPSEADFGKLLKFELQGLYFRVSDLKRQNPSSQRANSHQSEVKLFSKEKTIDFAKQSATLLEELKKEAFSNEQAVAIQHSVKDILDDFISNPDFETGLFNILEILSVAGVPLESETLTKRTIVAMGMKVRTKKIVKDEDNKPNKRDHLAIMIASYLADVGYAKLDISENPKLTKEEYVTVQQHPIISYLMTLPAQEISPEIRTLILNHHRPFRGSGINNNYPEPRLVFNRLMAVRDKFLKDVSKARIVADIESQLRFQESQSSNTNYEEDIAILSLASEYASLTSEQPWRKAFTSSMALKIILNDSFFSYSNKNIRHLLDYVGASLTNNENIINVDSLIITASIDSEKQVHFDICKVIEVDRYQTRPKVQRICTIKPIFKKGYKYKIADFDAQQVRMDRRRAIIDLASQSASSQRVIYIIDPEINEPLFNAVNQISKAS